MTGVDVAVWGKVLSEIQKSISQQRFSLWFKNVELLSQVDGHVVIGTPNLFIQEWLQDHYSKIIADSFHEITDTRPDVEFRVDPQLFHRMRSAQSKDRATTEAEIALRRTPSRRNPPQFRKDLLLDNFVVGSCNSLAYAAALEVAKGNSDMYNPLFIHGGVGLGKTHLLQGICNEYLRLNEAADIIYVSGEGFTNQFLYALRNHSVDSFRHAFRRADLLVIDDIHFIANTRATQQEFLHTFNELSCSYKQIVMASDAHPTHIKSLQQGIVNRCVSGMVAPLKKPDYHTRLAILREKTRKLPRHFPVTVLEYLARHIDANIRELEGAVTTSVAYAALTKTPISLDTSREVLSQLLGIRSSAISMETISSAVTEYFGLKKGALLTKSRARSVSVPRQIAFYLARELTECSYSEIGKFFGGRNHSTALSGVRRVETLLKKDSTLKASLQEITELVKRHPHN